jgi:MinD-like ATPase involved in chromosome partitioning or flagellar assembly
MPIRAVTLAGDAEREAALATEFSALDDVELVLRCVDRVEVLAAIRAGNLDAIVSIGAPGWLDRQTAEEAATAGIQLIGLADNALEDERLEQLGAMVLDAGVSGHDIIEACRTAREPVAPRPVAEDGAGPGGKLIAVWGPKGSPGRTTIAIELACELAAGGAETLLVDADSYGGDILQLLGIVEELPTVLWAATVAAKESLNKTEFLSNARRASPTGPIVLPGLPRSDLWAEISDFGWRELLRFCHTSFPYTVCDVGFCLEGDSLFPYSPPGGGRNRMARSTLTAADKVIAVCRADPIGLKNFIWSFGELDGIVDPEAVAIVVNRLHPSDRREVADILHRHLGRRPVAMVPDKPQDFARAVASGSSVVEERPHSDIRTAIRDVAARVGGPVRTEGLLSRLAGGRRG